MERTYLAQGARVELEHGSLYEITGAPIGSGGGSVIYPAARLCRQGDTLVPDGIGYALKECYPVSQQHGFVRNAAGQIGPAQPDGDAAAYLDRVKEMQLAEQRVTQQIYRTGSRLLPIRASARRVAITPPGGETAWVENTVTVMESLSDKGESLEAYLRHCRRMTTAQTFHVVRQLLFALREVHEAGFLHLDLQGRNVFLRGDLADGSDLVTIIDFGSARPLTDGRTEPIRDRVIFTTRGFSAPEILRENDGNLRLGPEADLYSVGCLILYLLTGSVYSPEELQSNTSGRYLTRFKLRRIDCPRHLVPRLQAIIARALENRPEDRYHSAGEMLEDVGDFCAALQPYRSDLAAVDYDAFLCYRHGPVDSAAARALQRHLEHFRTAPGFSGPRRPFDRVFLDEGELSSCADLGEQIRAALKNAGWLIVICSPETPNSPWVQREIETFLEYHDRSRILAVLTGGEPEESFPPQLRAGEGREEVLAADARGRDLRAVLRKLRRDALLRIAAPMLGTTYDALRQRRQIYRLQRAAAAATLCLAAAVAFSVYAFRREQTIAAQAARLREQTAQLEQEYENALRQEEIISTQAAELEEEYRNTLLEQSRYLLGDAQERLAENDVLGAIERLVAALPSEDQDRPVLPEVVYALADALGVYELPEDAEDTMTPVRSAALPDDTDADLLIDPTGQYLFTSARNTVYVWDAKTGALVRTLSDSDVDSVSLELTGEMLMSTRPCLLLDCFSSLVCWDYTTGAVVWQTETENPIYYSAVLSEDESSVILLEENCLQRLSTHDGTVLQTIPLSAENAMLRYQLACSPDGSIAAFAWEKRLTSGDETSDTAVSVFLADLEDGTVSELLRVEDGYYLSGLHCLDDSLAVLSCWNGGFFSGSYTLYGAKGLSLALYDFSTGEARWSTSVQSVSTGDMHEYTALEPVDYSGSGETGGRPAIVLYHAATVYVLDREDGSLLEHYELSSPIVSAYPRENGFLVFTRDGSSYFSSFDWPEMRSFYREDCFTGPITDVCWNQDSRYFYTMQTASAASISLYTPVRLVAYEYEGSRSAYEAAGSVAGDTQNLGIWCNGQICMNTRFYSLQTSFTLFDPNSGTTSTFQFPETEETVSILDYARTGDGRYLDCIIGDWQSPVLRRLDLEAETWTDYDLPVPVELREGEYWEPALSCCYHGGVLYLGAIYPPPVEAGQVRDGGSSRWEQVWVLASWTPGEDAEVIARYSLPPMEYTVSPDGEAGETYTLQSSYGSCASVFLYCDPNTQTAQFRLSQPVYRQDQLVGYTQYLVSVDLAAQAADAFQLNEDLSLLADSMTYGNTGAYWVEINRPYEDSVFTGTDILLFDAQGNLLHTLRYAEEFEDPTLFFSPDDAYLCTLSSSNLLRLYNTETGELAEEINLETFAASPLYWFSDVQPVAEDCLLLRFTGAGLLLDFSGAEPGVTAIIENCLGYDPEGDRFLVGQTDYSNDSAAYTYQIGAFHHYSLQELVELGRSRIGPDEP